MEARIQIKQTNIFYNETEIVIKSLDNMDIFKGLYQFLALDYPKFYKMDFLGKLAYLGASYLIQNNRYVLNCQDVSLIGMNSMSSYHADNEHAKLMQDGAQHISPAMFVNTLPNICLSEIAIAYRFKAEILFLIQAQFDVTFFREMARLCLKDNKSSYVLGGWVEYRGHHDWELDFYLLS